MYNIVQDIWAAVFFLFEGWCLHYFYGSFMESRLSLGKNGQTGIFTVILYGLSRVILSWVLPFDYGGIRTIVKFALLFMLLLVLLLCFYCVVNVKLCTISMFLIVTFIAVRELSAFIAYIAAQSAAYLYVVWNWCIEKGILVSEDALKMLVDATAFGSSVMLQTIFSLCLFLSLRSIVHNFQEKQIILHQSEQFFLIMPSVMSLLLCILLQTIFVSAKSGIADSASMGIPIQLYHQYKGLMPVVLAILVLSLLFILQGVKIFQNMADFHKEKSRRMVLEQQISSMRGHMEELERIDVGIRSIKHDMKNTLSVISQLASADDTVENKALQMYLSELNQTFVGLEFRFQTGNTVVDALLNMKYYEAARILPDLELDADQLLFPAALAVQSYDIGVIIGNALDNAVEACIRLRENKPEKSVFIRLSSRQKGKLLILSIANSFDGRLVQKPYTNFPETSKQDSKMSNIGKIHGLGLANINSTAQKYHGAVDYKTEGNIFILSVMLKIENS